jgi:hypothetical protein
VTRGDADHRPPGHGADSVLHGRGLEVVDDQGRVRASLKIQPGGTANGQPYPETVILRLIDPTGRPSVAASASLKLTNKDGQEQLIKP